VRVVHSAKELRELLQIQKKSGQTVGFVPTMGALHAGHARLIENARIECGIVVVSIFVNPLQFAPNEDFTRYPRNAEQDFEISSNSGADLVFLPSTEEMYPAPQLTFVEVTRVGDYLCGASRPGHFRGVATIVLKLFNIVQPDRAYFGEKDAQQLAVIKRMVRDMNLPITIVEVQTVRESDGLAMSSRNRYLKPAERKAAPALYRALEAAAKLAKSGERDARKIRDAGLVLLRAELSIRVDYFEVVDNEEMQPLQVVQPPFRIAGAIWIGTTRLIDNVLVS